MGNVSTCYTGTLQHKRLTGEEDKVTTELQVALDSGFESVNAMVANHTAETSSKLKQFSALNAEMTDKFIQSTEVIDLQ